MLLSFLPLLGLLEPLARLVGPAALSYGPDTLQEVSLLPGWGSAT